MTGVVPLPNFASEAHDARLYVEVGQVYRLRLLAVPGHQCHSYQLIHSFQDWPSLISRPLPHPLKVLSDNYVAVYVGPLHQDMKSFLKEVTNKVEPQKIFEIVQLEIPVKKYQAE